MNDPSETARFLSSFRSGVPLTGDVARDVPADQPGAPPYLDDLLGALDRSLDAALAYLRYLRGRRETLGVVLKRVD